MCVKIHIHVSAFYSKLYSTEYVNCVSVILQIIVLLNRIQHAQKL